MFWEEQGADRVFARREIGSLVADKE